MDRIVETMCQEIAASLIGEHNPILPSPLLSDSVRLPSVFETSALATATHVAVAEELLCYAQASHLQLGAARIDQRLASLWFKQSFNTLDWDMPPLWDPIAGDYETRDGWIRLHTNAPAHRDSALSVLRVAPDRDKVADAVKLWSAAELEKAIVDANGCAAEMRSLEDWQHHPQGLAVASEPLIAWQKTHSVQAPEPVGSTARPLQGVRVLDLTRVLAGPACTRLLAAFGATVLRIDPPDWNEFLATVEMSVGKRRAGLNLKAKPDLERLCELTRSADVIVHGYRADALEQLGFGEAVRRELNPSLIDVALCAYGWSGPWRHRRGFDSLVQMSSGIADAGMRAMASDKPVPLPVQALDYGTGHLLALAVIHALTQRRLNGDIYKARLSLARTAHMLAAYPSETSAGDLQAAQEADYLPEPETTGWGTIRRLRFPIEFEHCRAAWAHQAGELRVDTPTWA